ncbi:cobalt ECF transporter T component CbiQ [Spirulina sp. CS-785/01]|uniref:cobalt ECF transporter T component CbiQ n=1 Tax=Spirulina sp. CS-785/01 TaxID=3021716 RepID=UPI00232F67D9|nr:cobalt ECF transporter T component CbiQ [Spirulina sp. CS-785/01]MDB9314156.1 cobalt ECF transporter T component CbiQ [Spirulina sp. CS-785/01]
MKLALDRYAHLNSLIHQWEQRSKLVGLLSLIFAFSFVETLPLLPFMVVVTGILYRLSELPFNFWLSRLRYPGFFIVVIVIFLPFFAGDTPLWEWGGLKIMQEGGEAVILIVTRFLCILTVSLVLFGTAPFPTSLQAMRSLGIPSELVDMALLAYRYLEELGETRVRMQRAMQLRGFQSTRFSRRQLNLLAGLTGSLLVRSYDRSKRVYQAMLLRGYGQVTSHKSLQQCDRQSLVLTGLFVVISLIFFWFEIVGM